MGVHGLSTSIPGLRRISRKCTRAREHASGYFHRPWRMRRLIFPRATCRAALRPLEKQLGCPSSSSHDLRHYFISSCVMAGVDYLTIAGWVGHRDGGVLIGRVYGHLNNEHVRAQAAKLTTL